MASKYRFELIDQVQPSTLVALVTKISLPVNSIYKYNLEQTWSTGLLFVSTVQLILVAKATEMLNISNY